MSKKTGATTRPPSHGATPHGTISNKEEDVRYDMNHRNRGRALVINNMHFNIERDNRPESSEDVLAIKPALRSLGFEVQSKYDLEEQAMLDFFQEEVKKDHTDEDCFLCVLMSHGKPGDVILDIDGKPVKLRALVDMLGGSNCPSLLGKPKIFIIVACRGNQVDEGLDCPDGMKELTLHDPAADADTDAFVSTGEVEEEKDVPLPFEQDFLYVYSTAEGYYSFRGKEGTHFVQRLCEVLEERGSELEVCQLLTLAINLTAHLYQASNEGTPWHGTKQCPSYVSCLTKALYFPPKHY